MKLRNIILGLLLVLAASSCKPSAEYYVLEGGDPNIDWFEFVNDSTIKATHKTVRIKRRYLLGSLNFSFFLFKTGLIYFPPIPSIAYARDL